jgi:hypothetical protein
MNNKAKSNTPTEETTRALVPKLRFPEFRESHTKPRSHEEGGRQ